MTQTRYNHKFCIKCLNKWQKSLVVVSHDKEFLEEGGINATG